MSSDYAVLARQGRVAVPLLSGLIARLPNSMLALAISLAAVEATGSYAIAGACTAAFVLPLTLSSPLWSRAADRWPPSAILLLTSIAQAVAIGMIAAVAHADLATPWLIAACLLVGVVPPPTTTVVRAMWSRTLGDARALSAAFSLESIFTDVAYVIGPAAVAGLVAIGSPPAALVVAAAATLIGNLVLAGSSRVRAVVPETVRRHWLGALRWPGVVVTLPVGFFLIGSLTATELSLVASADGTGMAGVLVAVMSIGGVVSGLLWGRRARDRQRVRDLSLLLIALAGGWALLAIPAPLPVTFGLLLVVGFALSPAIITHYNLMHDLAPRTALTESFGWLTAAGSVGAGIGSLVVGFVLSHEPHLGFLVAAGMAALAAVYVVLVVRPYVFRRSRSAPYRTRSQEYGGDAIEHAADG